MFVGRPGWLVYSAYMSSVGVYVDLPTGVPLQAMIRSWAPTHSGVQLYWLHSQAIARLAFFMLVSACMLPAGCHAPELCKWMSSFRAQLTNSWLVMLDAFPRTRGVVPRRDHQATSLCAQ